MPLNKTASLREAQKHIDQGRVSAAMSIYQKIVEGDSADLAAISMLGDLYVKAGRITEAVEHFLRISENYLSSGAGISGAYILRKVIKLDPTNPQALMRLGELELQDKKMDRAHDNFIEAGAAFWNKGNIKAAIQMNRRALEISPDSRLAKVALALIEREQQEPEPPPPEAQITCELPRISEQQRVTMELPAINDLSEILISISDGSDEVSTAGVFNGNQLQAETSLVTSPVRTAGALEVGASSDSISPRSKVSQEEEDAIIAQIAKAEILVGCGHIDQAIAQLRESLHDRPDHIQIREKLKDIYLRSGMIDRASEECVNIAGIYAALGDSNRAKDYVTRARLLISPEPYTSPAELRAGNLPKVEDTPVTTPAWTPDLNQTVAVM